MMRRILSLLLALMAAAPGLALADSARTSVLLTAGVVKRVDLDAGIVVLDSGRKIRTRAILMQGEFVDLASVKPQDDIFVSGLDLGFEQEAALAPARR